MENLIELKLKEGAENGEDDTLEYDLEELVDADEGIPLF